MIAFAKKPSPPPQNRRHGSSDDLVHTWSVSITPDCSGPNYTSIVQVSTSDQPPRARPQPAATTKISGFGTWWLVTLVAGGLIRMASTSNPPDRRAEMHRSLAAIRRIEQDFQAMPPWQRALTKINECMFIIQMDPKNAAAYNTRAWILATYPDARVRDGKKAVTDATMACKLTDWQVAYCLGTLAAAYAESGDFKNAVAWQEKAQKMYSAEDGRRWAFLLDLYRSGKPFREELKPDMPRHQPQTKELPPV
jgi:hypothetical protein